jgi:hypothetical protein
MAYSDQKFCDECKVELIRTSEEWYCCPEGHGKLVRAQDCRPGTALRERNRLLTAFERALPRWCRWLEKEKEVLQPKPLLRTKKPRQCPNLRRIDLFNA